MRIERGDLVHLGHGQPHLGRERLQVGRARQPYVSWTRCRCSISRSRSRRRSPSKAAISSARRRVELAPLVKRRRAPPPRAGGYAALTRVVVAGIRHCGAVLSVTLSMDRKDTSQERHKEGHSDLRRRATRASGHCRLTATRSNTTSMSSATRNRPPAALNGARPKSAWLTVIEPDTPSFPESTSSTTGTR